MFFLCQCLTARRQMVSLPAKKLSGLAFDERTKISTSSPDNADRKHEIIQMARSQETFSKKERQKKKLQKKKEKQLRRDEKRREDPKAKSFDDMIAYVDENGNISSTPPDPTKIKEIAAEDIDLDNSRQSAADDTPPTGKVSYFDPSKGYGFIINSMTGERLFVHINDSAGPLAEGDVVTYTPTRSPRGMQASSVRKIDDKTEDNASENPS